MKKLSLALLCAVSSAIAAPAYADALSTPAMSGPLTADPNPYSVDLGFLGKTYITGSVSGLAFAQTNSQHFFPRDTDDAVDLSNAQVFIQKTDGQFQYFIQAGEYALPSLASPYIESNDITGKTYGVVPVAYGKFIINDQFSVQAGKLPTLIGDEYTFTFQNMNIERGLLWNQEPAISRGVQLNYASGPLSASISWNDGYYSNRWNWVSGLLSYGFNSGADTVAFAGGGNLGGSLPVGGFATPPAQNSGSIFNLIYTHTDGPWVISPYIQYQDVPKNLALGYTSDSNMFGAAVLATYSFNDNWKLSGRVEYETEDSKHGAANLLFGPGSDGTSLTITPTYLYKIFFARIEGSYTFATDATKGRFGKPGLALGPNGNDTDQGRAMLEVGVNF
ncbi:MAG TPA: outer membrane beta-barrel protein [Rhizomicrobium sp.]|jgi:hypothetical protein